MKLNMLLFLTALCIKSVICDEYLEVNINQGPVRGYKTPEGIFTFYGIPYATTPTGPDKFKAPLPPPTWEIPFEATENNIACPQGGFYGIKVNLTIKEDCLITNIYVPDSEKVKFPVVVYFHGGAYQYGYGEMMSPKHIVSSKKVIALNFNYRLGAHGFLCLGTKDVPGNAGMKDQVALLRWVQENIEFFGGNPQDVTIAGCSAGGSSVDLHLVSKMSVGLFHKAIPESSASVEAYSAQIDPIKNAKRYAELLNFNNVENVTVLEDFYKNVSFSLLTSINNYENLDSSVVFSPCIERDIDNNGFLTNDPVFILKSGAYQQIPTLYGTNNLDGLFRLNYFNRWKNKMNENFANFLPDNLEFKNEREKTQVAQKIKYFYFGNSTIDENTLQSYVNYFTDITVLYGVLKSVKLQTEAGNKNIYLYEYNFDNIKEYYLSNDLHGAGHCYQSEAILDEANETELPEEYQRMKISLRRLWLNFITTGKPIPEGHDYLKWPPVSLNSAPYMVLDTKMELKDKLHPGRAEFWEKIYSKYYKRPLPPRL